jgi:hypothetical protein
MKKILVLVIVLFSIASLYAQSVGDFGSITQGAVNWGDLTTWKQWDGIGWNTTPTAIPSATDNVWILAGDTLNLNIAIVTCNNLNIAGTLQFSKTLTTGTAMQVNGNILIQAGAVFKVQVNTITGSSGLVHTLELKGDLTNNGSVFDFRSGTAGSTLSVCNLTLSGSTNSTITSNPTYNSTNGDFNAVTINKTGGAKVILGNNMVIDGGSSTGLASANSILTFVSGIVETGNFVLVALTSTETNVIGYSSSSYVNGAMGRGMSNSAGANKNFPVGDVNGFRLFNLRSTTAGSATGHYAIVRCISGNANTGSSVLTNGIDAVSHVRYFQVGYNNTGAGAANMSFDRFEVSYGSDDGVLPGNTNLKVAYSVDSMATWNGIMQSSPHTTIIASSDPQTIIIPDALAVPLNVLAKGASIFVSLADTLGGANSLPVELTSFTALNTNNCVNLSWSTATELNNNGFDVEKSIGKSSSWEKIGFVKGTENSSSVNKYSFLDKGPFLTGKYQYRLRQNDINGTFKYSNVVEVEITLPTAYSLSQNYPNPFNPSTTIEYALPKAGNVELIIFNSIGQEVSHLINEFQEPGNYLFNFNANNLSTGVYFYRLKTNDYVSIKKMILIK